ncbi:MAG: hypothetical protein JSU86_10790, partial [Phycisphaerales bacterium]
SIQVIPEQMDDAVPGQKCVLLITVEDGGSSQAASVALSASATGADVSVNPTSITPDEVAEVTVIPHQPIAAKLRQDRARQPIIDDEEEPWTVTATIHAEREGVERTASVDIIVSRGQDDLGETAAAYRDLFIPWLAANHPELGITTDTEWEGIIVRPHIVVVMYYLFFSEEWEMGVSWHVMIPPHDWSRIYLRRRFTESAPSLAFEISSTSDAEEEPFDIELPLSVWR